MDALLTILDENGWWILPILAIIGMGRSMSKQSDMYKKQLQATDFAYKELRVQCERLKAENAELRRRLGE